MFVLTICARDRKSMHGDRSHDDMSLWSGTYEQLQTFPEDRSSQEVEENEFSQCHHHHTE